MMDYGGYRNPYQRPEESVYSLIPEERVVPPKPAMYKSKFTPEIVEKKEALSIGKPSQKPDPKNYLKKRSSDAKPATGNFQYSDAATRKPSVPTREQKPIYGLKTSKDYVTANAVENILRIPAPNRNEEPDWLQKPDYGQVPEYLRKVNQEREEEENFIRELKEAQQRDTNMQVLPEDDRLEILAGLKKRWEELNKQYIKHTSCVIDTIKKRLRKENLEAQLAQVEKDIEKMSKPHVVIMKEDTYQ